MVEDETNKTNGCQPGARHMIDSLVHGAPVSCDYLTPFVRTSNLFESTPNDVYFIKQKRVQQTINW
jgi:hypothetical protein